MASDRLVNPQDVLRAVLHVRRQGIVSTMRHLEATEPDLTEFLLEETSLIYAELSKLGGTARQVRHLHDRVQLLALVLTSSLRNAQLRLWQEDAKGTLLERLDQPEADRSIGDDREN